VIAADETRRLTFLRHTQNDGDVLTLQGIAAAVQIGEQFAATTFSLVVVSGAQRTAQTAACVLASGRLPVARGVFVHAGFGSSDWDSWGRLIDKAGTADIQGLSQANPEFVAAAAAAIDEAITWTTAQLGSGGHALVISHSPLIELALWRITGAVTPSLSRGQWVTSEVPASPKRRSGG